jgi:hypothetical protein
MATQSRGFTGLFVVSVWSFISQYVWQSRYICLVLYLPIGVAVTIYLSGPLSPNTCGSHDISVWSFISQYVWQSRYIWTLTKGQTDTNKTKFQMSSKCQWHKTTLSDPTYCLFCWLCAVPNINVIADTRRAHWIWYQHFYY